MGRINKVCEFGFIHETSRCRCMDSHVTRRQIKCDVPERHGENKGVAKTLRERLEVSVDSFFGIWISSEARGLLVDKLELAVKDWLLDFSNHDIKE